MAVNESIQQWAAWLEATRPAQAIAESDYLFPNFETLHVIGLALMVGTIAFLDLRLLGLASTRRSVRDVSREALPVAWIGFGIALISGVLLFASTATRYVENPAFRIKFLVLLLAGINMLVFHFLTWRSIDTWDDAPRPPAAVKTAGAVSLSCWVVIIFLGRWIGFV